ncbi:(2Fe-2S)-binding protein [Lacrimispora sp. 210928-DFI.3.58]|uniref:(2Fe-2S)-binding protein n=1 Tax=Lacrimispora sp. 210928-DFI.3.58 TaxID=2883214 RepID=UPI0015B5D0E1|nr:(2Fe-2S)-binding protein [Lacrimispora sp. 210928-DFI.3.58]MCB7318269.1 (2Fe-2S)-binding protein [Lacrimispora sp. 210928-DFI.3.58]
MEQISLLINGEIRQTEVCSDDTLLYVLRERLFLTGTKEGCGEGDCGACTVLVDGKAVNSCIYPVIQAQGKEILTIEGVEKDPELARIQRAFVDHGAVQCGFCSPGMILAASALLKEHPNPTEAEIRRGLSGNLCRCTGYQAMVDAVESLIR